MDHAKKLDFVHRMAKLALQHVPHYDAGGTVSTMPVPGVQGPSSNGTNTSHADPMASWGGGIGASLGLQSTYAAGAADLQNGTNADQLNSAYNNTQHSLNDQGNFSATLQPQVSQAVDTQGQLTNQFMDEANGRGPNVAQNQLNQATGVNVSNQAALMAGQRGASANPALIARQAAQQGAATQQAAAGQAATLGAQQQIAAQQNAASLANTQISQSGQALSSNAQAQQGEQNILQNSNTATNNANVGMQSNINTTNAATAASNASGIGGLIGGAISGAGAIFSAFADGGEVKPSGNDLIKGNPLVQPMAAAAPQSFVGNYLSGGPTAAGGPATSGPAGFGAYDTSAEQKNISDGMKGIAQYANSTPAAVGSAGFIPGGGYNDASSLPIGSTATAGGAADGLMGLGALAAQGGIAAHGTVQAMVSPGERYLSPKDVKEVAKGKKAPLAAGEKIPGRPEFKGNDYRNDVVPKKLQEGGIVIPNKILQSKNPGHEAKKFVIKVLAKKGLRK